MITEERLKEIEDTLKDSGTEVWRFPGWKEELMPKQDEPGGKGYIVRHCFIPELDELEPTGIQNSNDHVDWRVWDFIIKSHNEFVPELITEVRRLRAVVELALVQRVEEIEKALKESPFNP